MHGHIKWLLNKGMKTIFYPCVSYEENLVPNTDNHYNCPVVANYPLVVGANMPELRDPDVRYMHPYFNLANHELMVDRIRRRVRMGQRDPRRSRNRSQGRLRRRQGLQARRAAGRPQPRSPT